MKSIAQARSTSLRDSPTAQIHNELVLSARHKAVMLSDSWCVNFYEEFISWFIMSASSYKKLAVDKYENNGDNSAITVNIVKIAVNLKRQKTGKKTQQF